MINRFISETQKVKFNREKIKNPSNWFNKQLSSKLNIPLPTTYISSNEKINFNIKRCLPYIEEPKLYRTFIYKKKTKLLNVPKFVPVVKSSDKKVLSKLTTNLLKIDSKNKTQIQALETRKKNLDHISKNITKSKQNQIYPSKIQSKTIQKWICKHIECYDKCVDLYNQDKTYFNEGYKSAKLKVFKELYDGDKDCPYDILTDTVRIFCSNLKSCNSNLKNGHIRKFEMMHINSYKKTNTIFIPKSAIKNGKIYGRYLGKMNGLKNINNVDRDCTLTFNKSKNKYWLTIPIVVERKEIKNRESICGTDEGEVYFLAYHGENSFGEIGTYMRKTILKERDKISMIQKIIDKRKNKDGAKLKNRTKLRKRIQIKYDKIKNVVKELHNKTALFLCKKFDKILLPKFETQKMVMDKKYKKSYYQKIKEEKGEEEMKKVIRETTKKRRLNKKTKFVLNMLSHYKFKQHLINKGEEYGCVIETEADENETTKTCTFCGSMDNKKNGRIRECLCCGLKMNRDISASRNTLLKNINKEEIKK